MRMTDDDLDGPDLEVPEADAIEQQQSLGDVGGEPPLDPDAPEADQLEQRRAVTDDEQP